MSAQQGQVSAHKVLVFSYINTTVMTIAIEQWHVSLEFMR